MKDAKETPDSYNKKFRPAWFSAEVTSFCGYCDIRYAGQMMRRSALRVLPHVAALFSLRLCDAARAAGGKGRSASTGDDLGRGVVP